MSTMTVERVPGRDTATRPEPTPIPMPRIIGVELRKMFDTRSGFWLMTSIAITALLATGAVILFAPDDAITYNSFAAAIGVPMTIILPIIAILSVTSEWSQRSGLTTFTLVPHRGRVVWAKAIAAVGIGVVSIVVAFAIGALGNMVGSAITGNDLVWDLTVREPALHHPGERPRHADRVHAGRADPELGRRDRRLLRVLAGAADDLRAAGANSRTGSRTRGAGSTSTSPGALCSTGA